MSRNPQVRSSPFYRLAWVFYLVLAVGGAVWIGWRRSSIDLALFVDAESWWIDVALGIGAALGLLAMWEIARRTIPAAGKLEEELARLLEQVDLPEVAGLAMLSGFAEELFFRGAMQDAWGWFPATVLFALMHSGPGRPFRLWTAFAAVAGLVLAWLMIWRGNLLAPVVAHALVNGINLARLVRRTPAQSAGPPHA